MFLTGATKHWLYHHAADAEADAEADADAGGDDKPASRAERLGIATNAVFGSRKGLVASAAELSQRQCCEGNCLRIAAPEELDSIIAEWDGCETREEYWRCLKRALALQP